MRKYDFIAASNGDIVVDEHGVQFEIFLSKAGAEKGYPILAVNQDQRLFIILTLEGKCPVTPSFGSRSMVKQMKFFHLPVKKSGWVNLYKINKLEGRAYASKVFADKGEAVRQAKNDLSGNKLYLATTLVEWEE